MVLCSSINFITVIVAEKKICGIQKDVHTRNEKGQEHTDEINTNIGRVGSNGKPKDTCTTIMNTVASCEKSREIRPQPHTQQARKVL